MNLIDGEGPFKVVNQVFYRDGKPYIVLRSKETMRWREYPVTEEQLEKLAKNGTGEVVL